MKRILLYLLVLLAIPAFAFADLEAHFLDVGHGDCTILLCDGEAAIVDGGPVSSSDMVFTYLRDLGVTEIRYAFATHPQTDHVGGLPAAFHAAKMQALYTPVTEYDNARFGVLMDKAEEMNVPVIVPAVGDQLALGSATITVLSPAKGYTDPNDLSLVLRIDHDSMSLLICGDAGADVEADLIASGANLDVDVIRISHHGSDTATTPKFVAAASPKYAVISCSERYNNPDPDIMQLLLRCEIPVLCTDYLGTIVIEKDDLMCKKEYDPIKCEKWYVGNMRTEVFHRHTCSSVDKMSKSNKVALYSTEEAEHKGYRPCKNCSP